MLNVILGTSIVLTTLLMVAALVGRRAWQSETQRLHAQLDAGRVPTTHTMVDFRELDALPGPVQRYFRTVLTDGQPVIASARFAHRGSFNMGEKVDQWKPFVSDQQIIAQRPGFDWSARIALFPGVPVRVHDAYITGVGMLHVSLLGVVSLANLKDEIDMAAGELMRFLAEAAWYPTALLPNENVTWQVVDDRAARVALRDRALTVTLLFAFNDEHLIESMRADARTRIVNGQLVKTAWQGRFWNYQQVDGMQVPADGEVAWLLDTGPKPYWRGHLTSVRYQYQ
jgi:hypothetical protein